MVCSFLPLRVTETDGGAAAAAAAVAAYTLLLDRYGTLGVLAGSQGTMNNFTFGNEGEEQYYETICGGTGASPNGAMCSTFITHFERVLALAGVVVLVIVVVVGGRSTVVLPQVMDVLPPLALCVFVV